MPKINPRDLVGLLSKMLRRAGLRNYPVVMIDTKGTEKEVVAMTMMRRDEGCNMQDEFLEMLDVWEVMIGCVNPSREDIYYISKNPGKHKIFKVSLGFFDMKNGGMDGKCGIDHIGKKLVYKKDCKNKNWVDKLFGVTTIRVGNWTRWATLLLI